MAFDGSYPAAPGNKPWSQDDIAGPTSYTAITPGTPPTGGQSIPASRFGLTAIENVVAIMGDSTGAYKVIPYLATYNANQPATSVLLQWITAATGAEVAGATNLSAKKVRLLVLGY